MLDVDSTLIAAIISAAVSVVALTLSIVVALSTASWQVQAMRRVARQQDRTARELAEFQAILQDDITQRQTQIARADMERNRLDAEHRAKASSYIQLLDWLAEVEQWLRLLVDSHREELGNDVQREFARDALPLPFVLSLLLRKMVSAPEPAGRGRQVAIDSFITTQQRKMPGHVPVVHTWSEGIRNKRTNLVHQLDRLLSIDNVRRQPKLLGQAGNDFTPPYRRGQDIVPRDDHSFSYSVKPVQDSLEELRKLAFAELETLRSDPTAIMPIVRSRPAKPTSK